MAKKQPTLVYCNLQQDPAKDKKCNQQTLESSSDQQEIATIL